MFEYESIAQEEYETVVAQLAVMLDQLVAGYGMDFTPFETRGLTILGEDWLLLYSTAVSDEAYFEVDCLVYHDEKCVLFCILVSGLAISDQAESDIAELNEYLRVMISSLTVEKD